MCPPRAGVGQLHYRVLRELIRGRQAPVLYVGDVRARRGRRRGTGQVYTSQVHETISRDIEELLRRLRMQDWHVAAEPRGHVCAWKLYAVIEGTVGRGPGGEIRRWIASHAGERRVRHSIAAADHELITLVPAEQLRRPGKAEARLEIPLLDREDVARSSANPRESKRRH